VDDASVKLLAQWRTGDERAADELFRRYANRLIAMARSRLSPKLARRLDPEDVVQSAYRSFFAGARDGQFDIQRGGDVWKLLVAIVLHKLRNQAKHHTAAKRSIAAEQPFGSEDSLLGMQAAVIAESPTPLTALALVDELEHVMRDLEPEGRRILELRLQGHTQYEISNQTGRSVASVWTPRVGFHERPSCEQSKRGREAPLPLRRRLADRRAAPARRLLPAACRARK
jgi:RNA polymerase sigma-70 factor (ECF subfamily)